MKEVDQKKEMMNKIMKKYVDQVRGDPKKYIKDKTWFERLLSLHPRGIKYPVMYKDRSMPSFTNCFLYGLEFDFLMLNTLVVSCMDRTNYSDNKI